MRVNDITEIPLECASNHLMTERFFVVPGVGVLTVIGCCFYSCYRKYVRIDQNGPMNEVTASTVIIVDNIDCPSHMLSIPEQASAVEAHLQRDEDDDSIPEPIQITHTASSVPIIAQSCSAYR